MQPFSILLFFSLFRKDLFFLIGNHLGEFLIAVLGFLAAVILGHMVDGIRHFFFDKFQRQYGQYRCLWPITLADSDSRRLKYLDGICVLVGKQSSAMDKQEVRQWIRVNIYFPGELMGNLALTFPFLFGVAAAYLSCYFNLPIYWAVIIFVLGLLLSWFMFKISSIYITNSESNVSALMSNEGNK